MSGARVGLRFFQAARTTTLRPTLRTQKQLLGRRYQSTDAGSVAGVPRQPIANAGKESLLSRLWTSEVGIKTVHFWAPVMKWALVLAGVSDFFRPTEKLSLTQNLALMATGSIWTRWCFIIKPKNILLAAVNFCLAIVGVVQVSRIAMYNASHKGDSATEVAKDLSEDLNDSAKAAASDGKRLLEEKV